MTRVTSRIKVKKTRTYSQPKATHHQLLILLSSIFYLSPSHQPCHYLSDFCVILIEDTQIHYTLLDMPYRSLRLRASVSSSVAISLYHYIWGHTVKYPHAYYIATCPHAWSYHPTLLLSVKAQNTLTHIFMLLLFNKTCYERDEFSWTIAVGVVSLLKIFPLP